MHQSEKRAVFLLGILVFTLILVLIFEFTGMSVILYDPAPKVMHGVVEFEGGQREIYLDMGNFKMTLNDHFAVETTNTAVEESVTLTVPETSKENAFVYIRLNGIKGADVIITDETETIESTWGTVIQHNDHSKVNDTIKQGSMIINEGQYVISYSVSNGSMDDFMSMIRSIQVKNVN